MVITMHNASRPRAVKRRLHDSLYVLSWFVQRASDKPTLYWVQHEATFHSLMMGRVELAQICKGRATDHWFYTLRFCLDGERASYSTETEAEARKIAEAHANKVCRDPLPCPRERGRLEAVR